jgi:hypothetical protein
MTLTTFNYLPLPAEVEELSRAIRRKAAGLAKIDAERLTVSVRGLVGYERKGGLSGSEHAYVRAESADVKLDGREFSADKTELKIRWYVQQTMIAEHRTPDPRRLSVRHVIGKCLTCGTRGIRRLECAECGGSCCIKCGRSNTTPDMTEAEVLAARAICSECAAS